MGVGGHSSATQSHLLHCLNFLMQDFTGIQFVNSGTLAPHSSSQTPLSYDLCSFICKIFNHLEGSWTMISNFSLTLFISLTRTISGIYTNVLRLSKIETQICILIKIFTVVYKWASCGIVWKLWRQPLMSPQHPKKILNNWRIVML